MAAQKKPDEQIGKNPAEWLADVCQRIRYTGASSKVETVQAMPVVFNVPVPDTAEKKYEFLFSLKLNAFNAIEEIERLIQESFPDTYQNFRSILTHIKTKFVKIDPSSPWEDTRELFGDGGMHGSLKMISAVISEGVSQKTISAKELIDEARSLFETIQNSDLDDKLKQWILGLLNSIIKSIRDYQIYGYSSFEDRIKIILGELALHHEIVAEFKDKAPQGWKQFCEFISKGASTIRTSSSLISLAVNAPKFLKLIATGDSE